MNKYSRHFKVTSGPLLEEVERIQKANDSSREAIKSLINKLGAKEEYLVREDHFYAFLFDNEPDSKIYKRRGKGWFPKKNCKAGKEIVQELRQIKTINRQDALRVLGLSSDPTIFDGNYAYCSTLVTIPSDPIICFVQVPWYDEDPGVIEKYLKDRDAGVSYQSNLDAILWKPAPEMQEVKEWEVSKAIQEWNDSREAA